MSNKLFSAAVLMAAMAASTVSSHASDVWQLQAVNYHVDTLYQATIGPGTTEIEVRLTSPDPDPSVINVYYTVTDVTDPYVEMRAAKAGNHMRMLETVPDIAERMSAPGELYFAGVNADFFNMGFPYNPIGNCIANGFLTNFETDGADIDPYYIVFDAEGLPQLARHIQKDWFGSLTFANGGKYEFHLNTGRAEDEIIMYTPQWQSGYDGQVGRTGTNQYGVEVAVRPVGKNVLFGSTLSLEVIADPESDAGNMEIPSDGYVLSAHGAGCSYLSALRKGDVVNAKIGFAADNKPMKAKELLGGFPQILRNGYTQGVPMYPEHLRTLEPRTAVGYTDDGKHVIMLVVDGRKAGGSAGVTARQLGDIMRCVGCSEAMNFDGGGSSTMYVDGFGVKNVPSVSSLDTRVEGEPRVVVNGLFAVAIAPVDNVVARIEIREKKVSLSTGESFTPVVYAYNQYGVMVSTDLAGYTLTVPEQIGSVEGSTLTASDGHYSGLITVDYKGMTHSVPVHINGGGEFVTSGIDNVAADDNVTEEHYLINGIPVSSPQPGQITVTRHGSTVTKQLIR